MIGRKTLVEVRRELEEALRSAAAAKSEPVEFGSESDSHSREVVDSLNRFLLKDSSQTSKPKPKTPTV